MKKNKEDMKFIGIDGFEEIENVNPKQNEKKTKNGFKAVLLKAKAGLDKTKAGNASKPVVKHTSKRAVIAVAASVTAVMLSFVTVASALDKPEKKAAAVNEPAPKKAASIEQTTSLPLAVNTSVGTQACALYIDGKKAGTVKDGEALKNALNKFLLDARADYDDETTTKFANSVEVKPVNGDVKSFADPDALVAGVSDKLSVQLETDWTYETETAFESDITYDESEPSSYELVTQEGVNGKSEITFRLTYVDGIQTNAIITDEKVIVEPVREIKTVGCSDGVSAQYYSSNAGSASGSFIWPLPHTHNITSYMEWRWGRMHNGIDIAGGGDYGMPIIAADGGTVTWSGNDGGGYGNYVMIDHGNGYTTVYGHASSLAVSTGEYVSQGQTIAYVGSTGNSTGPHLHFEIRQNGEYLNPLSFVQ